MTVRTVIEPAEIGGTKVEPNSMLFVLIAAANRDPAQFANPETFDIARDPNQHLSFGEGIHFCLGSPLARLEGEIAIEAMLKRFPRLHLADPAAKPEYRGSMALRGLANLSIARD
jgi:cytochrome P450 family 107 subfamily K polypeptide 1